MMCTACGGHAVEVVHEKAVHTTETRVPLEYVRTFSRCDNCGDEFLTVDQSMANSRAIVAVVRDALGLLSPARILRARQRLGMTQVAFEHALGVGKKTVVRWERGTIAPSRGVNAGLWLAERYPHLFLEYARDRAAYDSVLNQSPALLRASVLQSSTEIIPTLSTPLFEERSGWTVPHIHTEPDVANSDLAGMAA